MTTSESWEDTGEFTINEKWTDSKGDAWYKVTFTSIYTTNTFYELLKIPKSGTVRERVISTKNYPDKIDPDDSKLYYRIWYRQE